MRNFLKRKNFVRFLLVLLCLILIFSNTFLLSAYSSSNLEDKILTLSVKNVKLIENVDGMSSYDYEANENYYRYFYTPEFEVVLKDGTVLNSNYGGIEYNGQYYSLSYQDNQSYKNQWNVGAYSVLAEFLGISDTFAVIIQECPVASVLVSNVEIMEYSDGYYDSDYNENTGEYDLEYFRYFYYPEYSVVLKNGSIIESDGGSVKIGDRWYGLSYNDNQSYTNQWGLGIHKVDAEFMGVETSFNVNITETNVKSIEAEVVRPLYAGIDSDLYYTLYVTINYKDGTATRGNLASFDQFEGIATKLEVNDCDENGWSVGNYKGKVTVASVTDEFEFKIIEFPYNEISISGENELLITFKSNKETITAKAMDFESSEWEFGFIKGDLITDIGTFDVTVLYESENESDILYEEGITLGIGDIESNNLVGNNWFKSWNYCSNVLGTVSVYSWYNEDIKYDISSEEKNIDDVVIISADLTGLAGNSDNIILEYGKEYAICDLQDIENCVYEVFGDINIDIKKSDNYDRINNTYKVLLLGGRGGPTDIEFSYYNGKWHTDMSSGDERVYVTLSDDFKIENIEITNPKSLDVRDLVRLKKYLAGIGSNIRTTDDYSNDGKINALDLSFLRIELLK